MGCLWRLDLAMVRVGHKERFNFLFLVGKNSSSGAFSLELWYDEEKADPAIPIPLVSGRGRQPDRFCLGARPDHPKNKFGNQLEQVRFSIPSEYPPGNQTGYGIGFMT